MSSKSTFAVGDIFRLKSGGPDMTVRTLPVTGSVVYICQWFAGKKLGKVCKTQLLRARSGG